MIWANEYECVVSLAAICYDVHAAMMWLVGGVFLCCFSFTKKVEWFVSGKEISSVYYRAKSKFVLRKLLAADRILLESSRALSKPKELNSLLPMPNAID